MKVRQKIGSNYRETCRRALKLALLTGVGWVLFALFPTPASALTTVPTLMNFQGRLTDSAGNIKPNGTYNMKLRLYTVASGGSTVWTEDRLVSASQGVTVTNGLFSIQLGSVTSLPASLFASGALYLEVELPTPATATSASPVWTEGAMSPRNQMATSAYAYNAETIDGLDSSALGQLSANNIFTGTSNIFRPGSNGAAVFDIQTASSQSLFNVDTTNSGTVSVVGSNGGETGAWATNTNALPATRYACSTVVANGYIYCIGGVTASTAQTTAYYAKLNADGSTGSWNTTTALPVGRQGAHASTVVANGYLYIVGGGQATAVNTVYYTKINADGTLGAWQSSANTLPVARNNNATIVIGGYLYSFGGINSSVSQTAVYFAKLNSDGSIGAWQTATNGLPLKRSSIGAVYANGYVYIPGGYDDTATNPTTVYYARVTPDGTVGSVGTWSTTTALPNGYANSSLVIANGYMYVMGGNSSAAAQSVVYYAKLNTDGTVGSWQTSVNALPAIRHSMGRAVVNGVVYGVGGIDTAAQSTVYYAKLGGTVKVGGSLDLVSLMGGNLADGGDNSSLGSVGGSITAGNIYSVGTVQVLKAASFADTVTVNGNFNAGNGVFSVDSATKTVSIIGDTTANRPASPTEGMIYYDTTTKQLLTYANGKWQADRSVNNKIIAPSNASQTAKDAADVVLTGTADQTLINTALTAAAGGTVYILGGTVSVTGSISMPNNTTLSGAGAGTIITVPNAQNGSYNIITNTDTTTGTQVNIRDLFLDGNSSNQTSGNMVGIYFNGMGTGITRNGGKINSVIIQNLKSGTGISLASSSNNTITNSTVRAGTYGISLSGSTNNTISNDNITSTTSRGISLAASSNTNTIANNTIQNSLEGIYITASSGNTVTGNNAQSSSDTGIYLTSASTNNTVTGNTVQASGSDGYVVSSSDSNTLTGNISQGNSGYGFDLLSSSYNVLSSNTTQGNSGYGIGLLSALNNQITSNKIHDNGGAGNNNGIYLSGADSNSITSNSITDTSATTTNYAISISNSTSDTNYLADNLLGTGSINDVGTGTIYGGQLNSSGAIINRTSGGFTVQSSAAANLFNVDPTNAGTVTILGNNSGEVGSWATSTSTMPALRFACGTVVMNGYIYCIGGANEFYASQSTVYYAKLNTDGSVGTWNTTSALPIARQGNHASTVAANGFIYVVGGSESASVNTVLYAKVNSDGTLAAWRTASTTLPVARNNTAVAVINGYLYSVGGTDANISQTGVYFAKLNADGSVGTWQTATNALPLKRSSLGVVYANGYLYAPGGWDDAANPTTVYYAKITPDGTTSSVGTWNTTSTMPNGVANASVVISNGYMYSVGGNNTAGAQAYVYYTKLNADGTVGTWQTAANQLPAVRHNMGRAVFNGYIYNVGGMGPSTAESTTYSARLGGVVQLGGSLDLVGLETQNLAESGGGSAGATGGSITAGNITAVGTLQVKRQAFFSDSASVLGDLSVGNGLFSVEAGNAVVRVGDSTPDGTGIVFVLDNKNTAGDPTGVEGGMYYNSSSKSFRCYMNGRWRSCVSGVVFANTTVPAAVSNTTTETDFAQNYSIPANDCQPGRVFRITAQGVYSIPTLTNPGITIKVKAGSTVLGTTGSNTLGTSVLTNRQWRVEFQFICLTTGVSGTVEAGGTFTRFTSATADALWEMSNTAPVTVDTTTAQTLQISAQWSAAAAANTITLRQLIVEESGP